MGVEHVYILNNNQSIYLVHFSSVLFITILTCTLYLHKISTKQKQIPQNELTLLNENCSIHFSVPVCMIYMKHN